MSSLWFKFDMFRFTPFASWGNRCQFGCIGMSTHVMVPIGCGMQRGMLHTNILGRHWHALCVGRGCRCNDAGCGRSLSMSTVSRMRAAGWNNRRSSCGNKGTSSNTSIVHFPLTGMNSQSLRTLTALTEVDRVNNLTSYAETFHLRV